MTAPGKGPGKPAKDDNSTRTQGATSVSDRWITFDNYGTLTNWLDGMRIALQTAGVDDEQQRERLLLEYHAQELVVEGPGWRPYREVLQLGLRRAAERLGIELSGARDRALLDAWGEQPIYADVSEALNALRHDGWKLVILTNCDNDLWALTAKNLPLQFDAVITAEDIRSYKPELQHFREFRSRISSDDIWVHAATSWVHDILPATRMAASTVWVDRDLTGHPADFPDRRIADIKSLPAAIAGMQSILGPIGTREAAHLEV